MWLDDNNDWEDLYKKAKERLQVARLDLLAAEAVMPKIEGELARIELAKKGVYPRHIGKKVLVNFGDAPNTPRIYTGIWNGKIGLAEISKKTGKALKSESRLNWYHGKIVRLMPDPTGDTNEG